MAGNCFCRKAAGVPVDRMKMGQQGVLTARKAIACQAVLTREETAGSLYLAILRANLDLVFSSQQKTHMKKNEQAQQRPTKVIKALK